MRYVPLGRTGMQVSRYCLGTMMFGEVGNPDHEECERMVRTALDAGVNVVDTADMYGAGESEEIVGRALKGRRDDVILATKVHFPTTEGPNQGGNSRRWITRAVEASLGRLQTDWLDLYQVHRPDETTDIEETLAVMSDLVSAGKVRAFGSSTFPAHDIVEAEHVATRMGRGRFRTEQPPYSLLARGAEAEVFPLAQRYGMGVLVWSPLAFGFLTGRYRSSGTWDSATGRPALRPSNFDPGDATTRAKLAVVDQLLEVATDVGCTLPELAIAFTLSHPAVTCTIIGPRTPAQLTATLAGAGLVLDNAVLDRLDAIVAPGRDVYDPRRGQLTASLREPEARRLPSHLRGAA